MSAREVLIVLAHAQLCEPCRERLLNDPASVSRGRALTDEEKALLARLSVPDFSSPEQLAQATGCTAGDLLEYRDHPVVRLRHF